MTSSKGDRGGLTIETDGSEMEQSSAVFSAGGELGARMRTVDWSKTPLGPLATWPQSLCSALSICLGSGFPIGIYWGADLVLLYNDAWSPILGEKHPWALGRAGRDVWPEIWTTIGPMFNQVLTTGKATYSEDSLLPMRRHGYTEECYFNFTFSPIRGESGRVEGIFNAVIETTYRVLAERRARLLRELGTGVAAASSTAGVAVLAAERFAAAPDDVPFCLIYIADPATHEARLVASAGISSDSAVAKAIISLKGAGEAEPWPLLSVQRSMEVAVVKGLDERFGMAIPRGKWPEAVSSALVVPLVLPSQRQPIAFLVLGANPRRAIDEHYLEFALKAGQQLAAHLASAQRSEELATLARARTTFFSNVSHEFRTPLTLMLSPIEDMRAMPLAQEDRERVELLHRNASRLLKLVNNLLDFSRLEAGRIEATYEPTDLAALTADLASTFRSAVERAGLALIVDCPPMPEPVFVDRAMWEKVVLNLLSNALKFTFEGSICVQLEAADTFVELRVRDTGTGIPAQEQPRLFERFHRIDGARSRSHEGSGIGLALVHELVQMHFGEIQVLSREHEGSTFSVRVPRGAAHLPAERVRSGNAHPDERPSAQAYVDEAALWSSQTDSEPPPGLTTGSRARILVADDNADMRAYLRRLLREHWDVEAVADGHEALAALRRSPPDLVISDVMMPGLSGFELLRAVRGDAGIASTQFILLSARAGEEATAEGLDAGADDYIVKPFSTRVLLVRVANRLAAAKAARQADEQRRDLYRNFVQAPFPVAVLRGSEHVIELANEAILEQWGKTAEVTGKPLHAALPELEGQPFLGLLNDVYRTGTSHHGRGELAKLPTGTNGALEDHYYNYVYSPLLDKNGAVEGVMMCAFDVTDQVKAQQRLEEAREQAEGLAAQLRITSQRLESAQHVGGIGVFDVDLRGGAVHWSRELYELMGLAPNAVEPSPNAWRERLFDLDRERAWDAFRAATEARADRFEIELRLKQPDGTTRWVRTSSSLDYDDAGVPTRLLGAAVDIEALKHVAAAREVERQRLFSILQHVPAVVNFLRGPDLVFEFAHPKAIEALGGREVLGKPLLLAMPEHREQPYYARMRRVYDTGEAFTQQEAILRTVVDGRESITYWDLVYLAVRDETGKVDGVMTFELDVTPAVLSRRELEQTARAKDEFLATMSHELRTPLNAMLGWAQILRGGAQDSTKLDHGLAVIERNAKAQARLVEDLMDVSRIISGKLRLVLKMTDVSAVIEAATEAVRPAADAKHIRLALDLAADVGVTVADPDRLQQVVWNLLSNAVRYTPAEGDVLVTSRREGSHITIAVQDTGVGIPAEHLPHVFERFRQVDSSTTRSQGGLGLGLAIVRYLVEAHGGSIVASSQGLGHGARFVAALPVTIEQNAEADRPSSPLASTEHAVVSVSSNELDGVRALLVDDDPDSLELLRIVLARAGATVTSATSATSALQQTGPFDVLISDIGMPEMDGYTLMQRIRARDLWTSVPAIALTAYARVEDEKLALQAGFQEHLVKPVDAAALIERVKKWTRAG
ncbi:MAG: ATP-binding protein [Polyangiaceae bacterium]